MNALAFSRTGHGDPLVLLHGIGSSRAAWEPVIPALSEQFDVVAVDLPGFGDSAPLPTTVEPTPHALAQAVAALLDELDLDTPHIAGNSLGGWVALELAAIRPVATVTLLSPAGMWPGDTPLYCLFSLRATRWLCRHAEPLLDRVVRWPSGRAVTFAQVAGRPRRMTVGAARAAVRAMGRAPGFDAALRATAHRHCRATRPLTAPVTVAFGSRDRLLVSRRWRRVEELPDGTRAGVLPGCGHVPMSDDPEAVAALVLTTVAGSIARR